MEYFEIDVLMKSSWYFLHVYCGHEGLIIELVARELKIALHMHGNMIFGEIMLDFELVSVA